MRVVCFCERVCYSFLKEASFKEISVFSYRKHCFQAVCASIFPDIPDTESLLMIKARVLGHGCFD